MRGYSKIHWSVELHGWEWGKTALVLVMINHPWCWWCTAPVINTDGSTGTCWGVDNTSYPWCKPAGMSRQQNAVPKSKGNVERFECFAGRPFSFAKNTRETVSNRIHWKVRENKLTLNHAVTISWLELHWNKLILLRLFSTVSKNLERILSTWVSQQCYSTWTKQGKMLLRRLQMKI